MGSCFMSSVARTPSTLETCAGSVHLASPARTPLKSCGSGIAASVRGGMAAELLLLRLLLLKLLLLPVPAGRNSSCC